MTADIALILAQDGLVNGAIYALVALALVLVYAVTRVIFIPQGELVAFGALSLASLQAGRVPATVYLLMAMAAVFTLVELVVAARLRSAAQAWRGLLLGAVIPAVVIAAVYAVAPLKPGYAVQVLLTIALVLPLGPMTYRLAFQPIADAPVLALLIVSVAVHFAYVGLGLIFFGPEGSRTIAPLDFAVLVAGLRISAQSLVVLGASVALMAALSLFFGHTLFGKALRATAVNRIGARIVGVRSSLAGATAFGLAALLAVVSGILISPTTTIYYDTGFLVGLKAFVGAIIGALVSYPVAAAGAVLVGLLESYASFWASAYKEVVVFMLIIPVLLWRSLSSPVIEEDGD